MARPSKSTEAFDFGSIGLEFDFDIMELKIKKFPLRSSLNHLCANLKSDVLRRKCVSILHQKQGIAEGLQFDKGGLWTVGCSRN